MTDRADRSDGFIPADTAGSDAAAAASADELELELSADELAELDALLADDDVWAEAPPSLEDSIVAAIAAEAAALAPSDHTGRADGDHTDTDHADHPRQADGDHADTGRTDTNNTGTGDTGADHTGAPVVSLASRRRTQWLALAAAAAVALVVAAGAVLFVRDDTADPDLVLALAGTDLAPAASADAEITTTPIGLKLIIDVRDLPPAPPGTYYQAWVRNDAGGVSAGTFHLRGGDGEIELWAGVSIEDYPLLTVTLQDEGAGPESSGRVVLRGLVEQP